MHLGFEAGDVAVAKVLAQLVDLLQLQEVDAQHLDRLHHLHKGTQQQSQNQFFPQSIGKKKNKTPKNQYSHPKSNLEQIPEAELYAFPFSTPHKKSQINQYSRPKPIPDPIPPHLHISFCSLSTTPLKSQEATVHRKLPSPSWELLPTPPKNSKPKPWMSKSVQFFSGGHFF